MKRILFAFVLFAFLATIFINATSKKDKGFIIKGEVKGFADNTWVSCQRITYMLKFWTPPGS